MKSSALVLFVSLPLAAAGAALVVLMGTGSSSAGETGRIAPGPNAEDGLALRLEALEAENRALRERVEALELRPATEARTPVVALDGLLSRDEFEAFRDELGRAPQLADDTSARMRELEELVADALETIRQRERVESVRAKQNQRLENLDQAMAVLDERLALSAFQSGRMRSALLAQYEREAELTRLWESGVDDEALGQRKAADRQTFQNEIGGFLAPEQVEGFARVTGRGK